MTAFAFGSLRAPRPALAGIGPGRPGPIPSRRSRPPRIVSHDRFLQRLGLDAALIEATRLRRNARYEALLREGVELIDGVAETLGALRGSVRMAIVTSTRPEHFALVHDRLGVREHFELVLTGADYTKFKPDPEPYLLAANCLGLQPADCLVVEDTERGLVSATRAGMRCVVIPRGLSAGGDYASAYRVLPDVEELVPLVRELTGRPGPRPA